MITTAELRNVPRNMCVFGRKNVVVEFPLEANAVNAALDALQRHEGGVRSVIVP
jgi:hypothetical protein